MNCHGCGGKKKPKSRLAEEERKETIAQTVITVVAAARH